VKEGVDVDGIERMIGVGGRCTHDEHGWDVFAVWLSNLTCTISLVLIAFTGSYGLVEWLCNDIVGCSLTLLWLCER